MSNWRPIQYNFSGSNLPNDWDDKQCISCLDLWMRHKIPLLSHFGHVMLTVTLEGDPDFKFRYTPINLTVEHRFFAYRLLETYFESWRLPGTGQRLRATLTNDFVTPRNIGVSIVHAHYP